MQVVTKIDKRAKSRTLKEMALLEENVIFHQLNSDFTGLSQVEAEDRLEEHGYNIVASERPTPWYKMLLHALSNPFVFVLAFLALISFLTRDMEGGIYMCLMIALSAGVSFVQEYKSQQASIALREMIENTASIKRDGRFGEIPMDEVVPGDIVSLRTGDMIPADAILLEAKDLFISQATLTGESFPIKKKLVSADEDVSQLQTLDMPNLLFMGTDVVSGSGEAIIVKTGNHTMFGAIAQKVTASKYHSSFEKGLRRVSRLLLTMVAVMFPLVFGINWLTKGDPLSAFFFAIAVAVGLTPEMLPMIVNTNLAKGAVTMSKEKVIVKELAAIQNLGAMDILCTDKTGTLTEDRVVMIDYVNAQGDKAENVLHAAFINSNYQTGWKNLMDFAVIDYFKKHGQALPFDKIEKVDEIPFDFTRRLLSVVVSIDGKNLQVTKGAVEEMQAICTHVIADGVRVPITDENLAAMRAVNLEMNKNGMRVLTVAQREITDEELENFDTSSERDMTLVGFVGFLDPAKVSAKSAVESLHEHGVTVKVLTGDNAIVAQNICAEVGIDAERYLLGSDIDKMDDADLFDAAMEIHLFAKLSPLQKSRIIELLKKVHTVGFMGDGINDAPALRAADVGISVDTAADITKEASSIILLEKSLQVLETGVIEGRKIFSNMMKYIRITLSSNFGNVFSVLVASAFLPFLPMLSIQLLTLNLVYDIGQLAIPWDNVDEEEITLPVKWETQGLAKFSFFIGPVSSIFDIVTFVVLWFVFGYQHPELAIYFQTGWFILSLITQTVAFHILRTHKLPFVKSIASVPVFLTTAVTFGLGALLMFSALGDVVSLATPQVSFWGWLAVIVLAYGLLLQLAKHLYYARYRREF